MAAKAASVPGVFFVREEGGIREYRLGANDLQILLAPDRSVPVAGCMVTYRVGSRNEAVGYTGSTHLLEHLMFKGSERFNKENGNTIWHALETKGAVVNATTWLDRTNYYEVVPREHLKTAIAIEADRMRGARILESDRASEMTVVRNEFERGENDPREALDKQLWAAAYQAHPYHHPTIGWRSDIESVSIERLKAFYDEFYWPNNATVTIAGDFDEVETLELLKDAFGAVARSDAPIPAMHTSEPSQEGPRRVVVERPDDIRIVGVAHKMPEALHADMPALILASLVLGEGKTSRLYRTLVDKALAADVSVWCYPFRDPSLFMTYATLAGDATHERVEDTIRTEYEKLAKTPPTAGELARAKRQYRAALATRRDGPYAFLSSINEDIARGDWTLFFSLPEAVMSVPASEVSAVVRKYLLNDSSSTIGWFKGKKARTAARAPRKTTKKRAKKPTTKRPAKPAKRAKAKARKR